MSCGEIWSFIKVYAVCVPNLCGEKSAWSKYVWRKMTNMRSDHPDTFQIMQTIFRLSSLFSYYLDTFQIIRTLCRSLDTLKIVLTFSDHPDTFQIVKTFFNHLVTCRIIPILLDYLAPCQIPPSRPASKNFPYLQKLSCQHC